MIRLAKMVRSSRQKLFIGDKAIGKRKRVYLFEIPFFKFKDHSRSHIPKWKLYIGWCLISWKVVEYESKGWPNKKIKINKVYLQTLTYWINKTFREDEINRIKNKFIKPFNKFTKSWWRKHLLISIIKKISNM